MSCCDDVKNGVIGITKSVLGIDPADDSVIAKRREMCRDCPNAVPCAKIIGKFCACSICGCLLSLKTKVKSERCPEGKW